MNKNQDIVKCREDFDAYVSLMRSAFNECPNMKKNFEEWLNNVEKEFHQHCKNETDNIKLYENTFYDFDTILIWYGY